METITKPLSYSVLTTRSLELGLTYSIKLSKENEWTRSRKRVFLDTLSRSRGVISVVCEMTEIPRPTYYFWRNSDPEFAAEVEEILRAKPEILEDLLFVKASKGDVGALKFMLSHIHPNYKKKPRNDKDTVVHIYHHVDKPEKKNRTTFAQMTWQEAARRRKESLAKLAIDEIKNEIPNLEEES